jgi:protein tyrosine kinase modulator
MLPGKTYKPEDILQILRRRIWFLVVPLALVSAGTAAVARKLPNRYKSEAIIQIIPQKVPENFVKATVTTTIQDRLAATQQQIMSRTRLERIILDFNLYAEERKSRIMEDVVQQMRDRDIKFEIIKGDAFRLSFFGDNPKTVMQVTDQLAGSIVTESTRDRSSLAENTNQFLDANLADAKRRLEEQEGKLKDYRLSHAADLPTQYESNNQAMQNMQMQLRSIAGELSNADIRRTTLEREINGLESDIAAGINSTPVDPGAPLTAAQELQRAKAALASALQTLKPNHPDIARFQKVVKDLEKKAEAEAATAPVSGQTSASPLEQARQKRLGLLRENLELVQKQIVGLREDEKKTRAAAAEYQSRLERLPIRDAEMISLTRDYDTIKASYQSLLARKEEAQLAANMESRAVGEQFRPLDSARLPERPFSPDRRMINFMGIAVGLGLGLGLIALLEYRDKSFKTDDEVAATLRLPVLAVVPLMRSVKEKKLAFRKRLILNATLGMTVLVSMAVLTYTFVR